MRPAGRAQNESLYFNYPFFSAPQGKKRDHLTSNAQVVIVGAGPIGMTAALALAREGVKSVLFDNKSTFNDGSRAICVARSSFYIFEALGVSPAFLKKSLNAKIYSSWRDKPRQWTSAICTNFINPRYKFYTL